jgi:hypothetical protein
MRRYTALVLPAETGQTPSRCVRSTTITLDTYSHAIPGLQRDAAEKVAALIPGALVTMTP